MSSDSDDDATAPPRGMAAYAAKGKAREYAMDTSVAGDDTLPWVEKYRPTELDQLVAHQDIVQTVSRFIDEKKLPHLLFYGPPGTGKTSLILAIARKLYGPKFQSMILELNASDERGIDVVREQVKEFASTRSVFSSAFKLIILDEADAMTQPAQAALRRVIEKYTKNARFCIICNYIRERISYVIEKERVNINESGLGALLRLSLGDMRKALNILQASAAAFDVVDADAIHMTTGAPLPQDVTSIVEWLLNEPYATAFNRIQNLKTAKGLALMDLLLEIHEYLIRVVIPAEHRMFLMDRLSTIENNLASGGSEKLQLGFLVGAFREAVESITTMGAAAVNEDAMES